MTFKVGDEVTWVSQANATWRRKTGTVIEVVPPNMTPTTRIRDRGWQRNHESYVVRATPERPNAHPRIYWPRASVLEAPTPPAGATP